MIGFLAQIRGDSADLLVDTRSKAGIWPVGYAGRRLYMSVL